MKKAIGLICLLLLVGCSCEDNSVIHSGKVETKYRTSLAIDGKLIEGVCMYSLAGISKGDYVNIYCQDTNWGCSYVASKITPTHKESKK